jgi:DNA-binding NtrC family response regulator
VSNSRLEHSGVAVEGIDVEAFSQKAPLTRAAKPMALDGRMRHIYSRVEQLGATRLPLLLLGETGTGKEVLASFAHRSSSVQDKSFVRINCAGLCDSVVDSELFGHERGAFTGAIQSHPGFFEVADGGTLFLDEVAELPLQTQAKLLRVLECGDFQRVGSTEMRRVKVRVIAATHRDLAQQVKLGRFRNDLFFRLNAATVHIPPLRERKSEILPLANYFLQRSQAGNSDSLRSLSEAARSALLRHDWPGNIRELRNVIEVAAALCPDAQIDVDNLPILAAEPEHCVSKEGPPSQSKVRTAERVAGLKNYLRACEHYLISRAIEESQGNQTEAARRLGISRRTLTGKLNTHGFARPRKRTNLGDVE